MPTNMGKLQVAPHNPGETDGQHPPNYNFYLVGKTAGNIHLFSRSQNLHIMAKCWCYDCQLKFLNKHIAGLNMQEEAMKLLRKTFWEQLGALRGQVASVRAQNRALERKRRFVIKLKRTQERKDRGSHRLPIIPPPPQFDEESDKASGP